MTVNEEKDVQTISAVADWDDVTIKDSHCPGLLGRVTCRDRMMTEGVISVFLGLFRWLIYNTVVIKTAFAAQLRKKKIFSENSQIFIPVFYLLLS